MLVSVIKKQIGTEMPKRLMTKKEYEESQTLIKRSSECNKVKKKGMLLV